NGAVRIERQFGSFTRSLTLPKGVDAESIDASFDRGVLEIHIPKPQADKPRKVAISVGSLEPTEMATLRGLSACGFGMWISSTPRSKLASMLSASTPLGNVSERVKLPNWRSMRTAP